MHKNHFAKVRKLLLDSSETIVQDDSGIPLAYFERRRWRFLAFGRYQGPISIFANFYQPRMAELFRNANPMDFGVGYQWRKNESNLVVAQKQPPPVGEEQLTAQSQAEGGTGGTAISSNKRARRTQRGATARLRIWEIFPILLVERLKFSGIRTPLVEALNENSRVGSLFGSSRGAPRRPPTTRILASRHPRVRQS